VCWWGGGERTRGRREGTGAGKGAGSSNDSGASGRLLFQALFFLPALLFFMTFNDLTKINLTRRKSVCYGAVLYWIGRVCDGIYRYRDRNINCA
jgi:hypothetical protein